MRVIVTGGAGFIGSHTVDQLIRNGAEVLIIDNMSTGKQENVNPAAELVKMDIESEGISDVFQKFRPEYLIHLAAQVSVPNSIKNPIHDSVVNIVGTVNLLENCRYYSVKKVVYASSAAVYGNPGGDTISESDPSLPLSFYGVSKLTPEVYLKVFNHLYGLKYTVLRYANVYGPRQDSQGEGGVISIFATKIIAGQNPIIYGDGEQTRDFVYVEDVAAANVEALQSADQLILNVGTGKRTSVNELVHIMSDAANSDIKPSYYPEREGDIKHSCMHNRQIKEHMEWEPQFTLTEGLSRTIDFYRNK